MTQPLHRSRQSGFTMIELLLVVGIMILLLGILGVAGQRLLGESYVKGTVSLIEQVSVALESYKNETGSYPKDGIDSAVRTPDGTRLQSGAVLWSSLGQPLQIVRRNAAGQVQDATEKEPVLDVAQKNLSAPYDDDPMARELLDAWGTPLHYDNVKDGYSPQSSGDFHLEPPANHLEDPRESLFVAKTGAQNRSKYDVWSHGKNGHLETEKIEEAITNFEFPVEESDQ